MKCPFCGLDNTRVIDSRPADDNSSIRRRRLCDECGKRFTTYERVEIMPLTVIKKDKTREPYDRSKMMSGILRACHKRPVSVEQIEQMVNKIENELFNLEYTRDKFLVDEARGKADALVLALFAYRAADGRAIEQVERGGK